MILRIAIIVISSIVVYRLQKSIVMEWITEWHKKHGGVK